MSTLKIGTLNLCLGLKGKKDLVKNILMENKIDILAIQEVEIGPDFDENTLVIPGYTLETENNTHKKRNGFYISNCLKYSRLDHLEGIGNQYTLKRKIDREESLIFCKKKFLTT